MKKTLDQMFRVVKLGAKASSPSSRNASNQGQG